MKQNHPFSESIHQRFKRTETLSLWKDVLSADWENWIWQHQNRLRKLDDFEKAFPLSSEEKECFEKASERFLAGVTPYYASLIDPQNPLCPIRLQCLPQKAELQVLDYEMEDPLGEDKHMPVEGLTHRYPDRVLLFTTHHCAVYCRHCLRKRKVSDPKEAVQLNQLETALTYIESHPEIRDVLLSGGDPFSLSDERLEYIFTRLRNIPHVEIIRIGTRNLVTLPQRVTSKLASLLSKFPPIYVQTHFNHPKECTEEAFEACKLLVEAGCILNNQMVLLRQVNDDAEIVKELNHRLLLMRVQPYYIHQCDMAQGISHFRTPISKGIEIIEKLRGWTSGMAVPHFAIDLPGGGGKVTLSPDYVVSKDGKKWCFRSYKGENFEYNEP